MTIFLVYSDNRATDDFINTIDNEIIRKVIVTYVNDILRAVNQNDMEFTFSYEFVNEEDYAVKLVSVRTLEPKN